MELYIRIANNYFSMFILHFTIIYTVSIAFSGVDRLGHTGARALAARGGAPPVQARMQIIGADSIVVDGESGANRS